MKAEIKSEMVIPEGVTVNVADTLVTVKGPKGEDSREYSYPGVGIVADGGKVTLSCSNDSIFVAIFFLLMMGCASSHMLEAKYSAIGIDWHGPKCYGITTVESPYNSSV